MWGALKSAEFRTLRPEAKCANFREEAEGGGVGALGSEFKRQQLAISLQTLRQCFCESCSEKGKN